MGRKSAKDLIDALYCGNFVSSLCPNFGYQQIAPRLEEQEQQNMILEYSDSDSDSHLLYPPALNQVNIDELKETC